MSDKPYAFQPIAWDRGPQRGHISIGDADVPDYLCGRRCLFEHALKAGANMEHAERVEKSTWDTVHPDEHVIETGRGTNADYPVGYRYHHAANWQLEQARDAGEHACANCGKKL